MATFPTYAAIRFDGYGEEPESAVLRTDMETGPAKQLKTKSRVMVSVSANIYIGSKANYSSFLSWFKTDINRGTDWFTWTNPVTGSSTQARIVGGKLGKAQPLGPDLGAWVIPCTLEYWDA